MKKTSLLLTLWFLITLITAKNQAGANDGKHLTNPFKVPLRAGTSGPLWPPSEVTDKNGDFIVIGSILIKFNSLNECMIPPPPQGDICLSHPGAFLVSKNTPPPDFPDLYSAPHLKIRDLDLSPGSPDLGLVLHTLSYGPPNAGFNGGPAIPMQGEGPNLSPYPPACPELFPSMNQEDLYTRESYPLHQAPVWGIQGDQIEYDPETGGVMNKHELPLDQRPRTEPITLGEWLKADQKGNVRVRLKHYDHNQKAYTAAKISLDMKDLIPDAVYTVWAIRAINVNPPPYLSPGQPFPIPDSLCFPNVLKTDNNGRARLMCHVENPFPQSDNPFFPPPNRLMGVAVSFHSDYQNWGACPSRFAEGVDNHVHLVAVPPEWNAFMTAPKE